LAGHFYIGDNKLAKRFDFSAQVVLAAPTNIKPIVSSIQQSLNGITANVNLKVSPGAQQSINGLNSSFQTFNSTLNLTQINIRNISNSLNGLKTAIGGINLSQVNNQFSQGTKLAAQQKVQITTLKQEMEEYGRVAGFALRKFSAWMIGSSLILTPLNMLKEATKSAVTFQDHMVKLSQLTGGSVTSTYKDLGDEITRLSTSLGVSSDKLLEVSNKLVQAGLSSRDTQVVMEALAKTLNAPAFDNINNTMEGTIALMRQFGIGANGVNGALSSMHALAAATAVESSDLIDAIRIAGGTFSVMSKGVVTGSEALNQFMALFTSVRSTTRESAESIATAMKTIFARLERPQNISSLKQLGVDVLDAKGRFIGAYEAIEKISEAVKKIPTGDVRLFQLAEDLGGYRQIGRLLPLLFQAEERQKALNIAKSGSAQLDEVNKRAQESWTVQITKTHERFLALIRDLSKTDTFKQMMTYVLGLANAFISLADSMKSILPYIAMIGGFKIAGAISQAIPGFIPALLGKNRPIAKANGGIIPGAGDEDSVPAILTPGEFVINKKAAQRIGRNNLEGLNNGILHFQHGGGVGDEYALETDPLIDKIKAKIPKFNIKQKINNLYSKISKLFTKNIAENFNEQNLIEEYSLQGAEQFQPGQSQVVISKTPRLGQKNIGDVSAKESLSLAEKRAWNIGINESRVSQGLQPSFKLNQQPLPQNMAAALGDKGTFYGPGGRPTTPTFLERQLPNITAKVNQYRRSMSGGTMQKIGGGLARGGRQLLKSPTGLMIGGMVADQMIGETPTGAAVSQGLGMAGMGAYMGSLIAPGVGTAIGGGLGAAYGALSGYSQKSTQIEQDRLAKSRVSAEQQLVRSTDAVTHAFNQLGKGGSVNDFIQTLNAAKLNIANVEKSRVAEKRAEAKLGDLTFTSTAQEKLSQEYYKLGGGKEKVEDEGGYRGILNSIIGVGLNVLGRPFGQEVSGESLWKPGTGPAEQYKIKRQATQNILAEELQELQGPATAAKSFFDNLLEQQGTSAKDIAAKPEYASGVSMYARYFGTGTDRKNILAARETKGEDSEEVRKLEQQAFINSRKIVDETTLKFKNLSNELAKSEVAFSKMAIETEKTTAKLEGIGNIGAQSRNLLQSMLSGSTGAAGTIPITNVFANQNAYSANQLKGAGESIFGGATLGTQSAFGIGKIKESRADIEAKIMGVSGETTESTQSAIMTVLDPYLKNLPENLRRQATAGIEKQFVSRDQSEQVYTGQNFVEKGGVSSIIEDLTKKLEPQEKLLLETVNKINEAMERRNSLIKQEHTQILKINDLRVRQSEFKATQPFALQSILKPGIPLSVGEATAGVSARRGELGRQFGLGFGESENIGAVGMRMGGLRSRAEQYNQQIGTIQSQLEARPGDQGLINKLTEANNGLNGVLREISSGNQLINDLKTDSTKQTAILGELNNLQKRREEGQKTVLDIATMSPEEQLKLARQLSVTQKFQESGQVPLTLQGRRDLKSGMKFMQGTGGLEPGKDLESQTGFVRGRYKDVGFVPAVGGWGERTMSLPGQDKRSDKLIKQFEKDQGLQRGAVGLEMGIAQIDQTEIAKNVAIIAQEIQKTLQEASGGNNPVIPTTINKTPGMLGGLGASIANVGGSTLQAMKNLPFVSSLFENEVKPSPLVNPFGAALPKNTIPANQIGTGGPNQTQNLGTFESFANSIDKLSTLNIPSTIELTANLTHTHNVVGTDSIGKAVVEEVKGYIESYLAAQLGKVVNPNTGETSAFQPTNPLKGTK
jgi:TP901 family phage tail tape measure protein